MLNSTINVAIIVATAAKGVIGRNNQLPWHLPQDLKYFKATTLGKPVIMGRKTFESIGRPLPGRPNLVVTRRDDWRAEGVEVESSLERAITRAGELVNVQGDIAPEVMIIGGAEIYRAAMELADRIYLTEIDLEVDGDARFPALMSEVWQLVSCIEGDSDAPLAHRFKIYERKPKQSIANN